MAHLPVYPFDRLNMKHELKTWPPYFKDVCDGKKTFEYRKDDRGFNVGDTLNLREWNPAIKEYTGKEVLVEVVYKISGEDVGIPREYCIMGIEKI
jgi:hypothetical protein